MADLGCFRGSEAGRLPCQASDHADEVDGTIAFASRAVAPLAIASATLRAPAGPGLGRPLDEESSHDDAGLSRRPGCPAAVALPCAMYAFLAAPLLLDQ